MVLVVLSQIVMELVVSGLIRTVGTSMPVNGTFWRIESWITVNSVYR